MGGGNSGPECSLFQSAGKSDKEVSLGTMGMEGGGEERAPFTQGTKVMALAECRLGVGLGLGAKFLNDWLAGRSLSPLLGT